VRRPAPGKFARTWSQDMNPQTHQCCKKRICMVCDSQYDAPTAIAEREAESKADPEDVMSLWGLCPQHHQLYSSGMVFILEVQIGPEEAARMLLGSLTPDGLARTGRMLTLPTAFVCETIDFPTGHMPACLFVPPGMFDLFSQLKPALQ
jgi:hypothetical protein